MAESEKPEGTPQTCPRRMGEPGPWDHKEGLDAWTLRNWRFRDPKEAAKYNQEKADRDNAEAKAKGHNSTTVPNLRYWLWDGPIPPPRTCSFCGGIRPEDALRLVLEHGYEVEGTTKAYKLYIHPPGFYDHMQEALLVIEQRKTLSEFHEVYPPLKAYSMHFGSANWTQLYLRAKRG